MLRSVLHKSVWGGVEVRHKTVMSNFPWLPAEVGNGVGNGEEPYADGPNDYDYYADKGGSQ